MEKIIKKNIITKKIENRFDLILIAAKRARQIQIERQKTFIKKHQNKCTIIALQEIEENLITTQIKTQYI